MFQCPKILPATVSLSRSIINNLGGSQLQQIRNFHVNPCLFEIRKLTRVRCVDNTAIGKQAMAEGKPPKVIHVYTKNSLGTIGDKVLVTIKGEMKKAIIVGVKKHQRHGIPKHDTNNVVLIDDNGTPLGTRIQAPVPMLLRQILKEKTFAKGADYTKVLSIASRFVHWQFNPAIYGEEVVVELSKFEIQTFSAALRLYL